mgnify:CR=1 FL=1
MRIDNGNQVSNKLLRVNFDKKGVVMAVSFWFGSEIYHYYNGNETRTVNNVMPDYMRPIQKNNEYKKFSMEDLKELYKKFDIEFGFSEQDQKNIFDKVNNTYYISSYIGDAYVTLFSIVTLRIEEKFLKEKLRIELKEELLQEILNERLPVKSNDSKLIKI